MTMAVTFRRRTLVTVAATCVAIIAIVGAWRLLRSPLSKLPGFVRSLMAPASSPVATSGDVPQSAAANAIDVTSRGDVSIDARRQQLIGVRTVTAKRQSLAQSITAVGQVRYDETRLTDVNLKLDGYIRDLFVDSTGQAVSLHQSLFTIYSPDLLATENEYLLALKMRDQLQRSPLADARLHSDQLVTAARQRLLLWDVPADVIDDLDQQHQPVAAITFRSPVSGFVIEKTVVKGMHVTAGQTLYKVADLSVVWIEANIYEQDIAQVRVGATSTVTLDAYPGQRFTGQLVYVYPTVDENTRTVKVRLTLDNRAGLLKPGMFANVELRGTGGTGVVVPIDAVLDSGREQIVFVAKGDGHFEPRRVKTGRRLADGIQILDGIKEGEQVATGATFFLDSESQLRASLQGFDAPAGASPAAGGATASQTQVTIGVRTQPDPPKTGSDNMFEITVKDAAGKPIEGADVSLQLFMAAMPTMNMPAMKNQVKVPAVGGGLYRGPGEVMMAGTWEVTVVVSRNGQRLGSKQLAMVSK